MMVHTIQRFTLFSAVQTRICLVEMLYFNVSIYAPPRYHNFITHRVFVLKLPIFQYFYWNNILNLNFCYIVFCGARNCILWYMNHIYNSIQRSSGNISHIGFMIFFKNAIEGFSFTIFCILSIADRFSLLQSNV